MKDMAWAVTAIALASLGRWPDVLLGTSTAVLGLMWLACLLVARQRPALRFAVPLLALCLAALPLAQEPVTVLHPLLVGGTLAFAVVAALDTIQPQRQSVRKWMPFLLMAGSLAVVLLAIPRLPMPLLASLWDTSSPAFLALIVAMLALFATAWHLLTTRPEATS